MNEMVENLNANYKQQYHPKKTTLNPTSETEQKLISHRKKWHESVYDENQRIES